MILSLGEIARALGGDVSGQQVVCPGPGHSRKDRSMWVRINANAPGGILCGSFCGDDWRNCKDYIRSRLGWTRGDDCWREAVAAAPTNYTDIEARKASARRIWGQTREARGTLAERYLKSRGIAYPENVADLRFHPHCPWRLDNGEVGRVQALIVPFRSLVTNEITGVHRIALTDHGEKMERRMLGIAGGSAIKLDGDDVITSSLVVGEGIETVLAGRQLGFRPAWAMGSVDAIRKLPVLKGILTITLLQEVGDSGASALACNECGERWHRAGREVFIAEPCIGSDMNDALTGVAR